MRSAVEPAETVDARVLASAPIFASDTGSDVKSCGAAEPFAPELAPSATTDRGSTLVGGEGEVTTESEVEVSVDSGSVGWAGESGPLDRRRACSGASWLSAASEDRAPRRLRSRASISR